MDDQNAAGAMPATVTCAMCGRVVLRDHADVIDERVTVCVSCIDATQREPWPSGSSLAWEGD